MQTIRDLLRTTKLPAVDARILLTHLCHQHFAWSRAQLIAHDHDPLPAALITEWLALEQRRVNGEPVAYIIGYKDFYDVRLTVTPDVLIPRPETELLVDLCIDLLRTASSHPQKIIDLGTGSGAIAIALSRYGFVHPQSNITLYATDLSANALEIAQTNLASQTDVLPITFLQSDWFSNIPSHQKFDFIVSNPPYIESQDIHLQLGDLRFEPRSALTDEQDGLSAYRTIIAQSKDYLVHNGVILLEHGFNQARPISELLKAHGYTNIHTYQDLAGLDRVILGHLI